MFITAAIALYLPLRELDDRQELLLGNVRPSRRGMDVAREMVPKNAFNMFNISTQLVFKISVCYSLLPLFSLHMAHS